MYAEIKRIGIKKSKRKGVEVENVAVDSVLVRQINAVTQHLESVLNDHRKCRSNPP